MLEDGDQADPEKEPTIGDDRFRFNYGVETATTSRSKCIHCRKLIEKNNPRIYKLVSNTMFKHRSPNEHYIK